MEKPSSKKPGYNAVLKYSGLAFNMMAIIASMSLGGKYLDAYLENSFPIYTLIGVLVSVFAAVYLSIRELLK
ncbi:MAG: AtpZ/AtpI family protein [Bacteroidia bacterium]